MTHDAKPSPGARWALPELAQAGAAAALAVLLVVLVAAAPIHVARIRDDWMVAASLKTVSTIASPQAYAIYVLCLRYLVTGIGLAAAGLLLWRRAGHPMALLAALACALLPMASNLGGYVETWPYPNPWDALLRVGQGILAAMTLMALLLLVHLFPDGRFASRWLIVPAALGVALMAGGLLAGDRGWALVMGGLVATLLVGCAGQIHRYRRTDVRSRQGAKPVVVALAALPLALVLAFASGALLDGSRFAPYSALANLHLQIIPSGLLAASLAWAVLRHDLWGSTDHLHARRLRWITVFAGLVVMLGVGLPFGVAVRTAHASAAITLLPAARPVPLIVDTDVSLDDTLALLVLLRHPSVDVRAITVSGTGEAHCKPGVRIVRSLLMLTDRAGVLVACGRETPLAGDHAFPAEWRKRADAAYGVKLPDPAPASDLPDAPTLIRAAVEAASENVAVLTLGPLTNLADALHTSPQIADKLAAIFIMGGAVQVEGNIAVAGVGNDNQVAEWNIWVDPAATNVVLAAGVPVVLVPLDATRYVPVTLDFYALLGTERSTASAELAHALLTANLDVIRSGGYQFWDVLSAALVIDERMARYQDVRLTVVEAEGAQSGRTVAARDGAPVRIAVWVDRPRFEKLFLRALNQ